MEDPRIACEQEPLLLWRAGGALSEAESRELAAHLAICARCRERLAETETLAQLVRAAPAPGESHPSPEDLSRMAGGDFGGLGLARSHVAACSECRELLSVIERVNRDLESLANEPGRLLVAGWRAFVERLRPLALSPLPAYILALILIYPAYLGVFGSAGLRERVRALEEPQLLDAPLPVDTESERGAGVGALRVDRTHGRAVLTFFVPISSERYRYRVELVQGAAGSDGRRLFVEPDARSFDRQGTFALLLPEHLLGAGEYEIRVEELHKTSGARVNLFSFPFRIEN